jgi:hypothetical protein
MEKDGMRKRSFSRLKSPHPVPLPARAGRGGKLKLCQYQIMLKFFQNPPMLLLAYRHHLKAKLAVDCIHMCFKTNRLFALGTKMFYSAVIAAYRSFPEK